MTVKRMREPHAPGKRHVFYASVQHGRFAMALVIVVALFGVLFVSSRTVGEEEEWGFFESHSDIADPVELIDAYDKKLEEGLAMSSDAFMTEVGLPEGARDVRYEEGHGVVGFMLDMNPEDTLECLNRLFAQRGYSAFDFTGIPGAAYSKSSGALTWVIASCSGIGDSTSVVLRFAE